ncbi:MAG: MarR family winged helix-turn-helix transcriptional regulator [Hyphomonas sp.]
MATNVNLNRSFDQRLFLMDQELDKSVGLLIAGVSEIITTAETAREKAGLSKAELHIIMAVRHRPGLTVTEMRTSLGMTTPTFARLIGTLEKRGLIQRTRGAKDARQRRLTLSEAGTTLSTPIAIAMRDRLRNAFRVAGPDAVAGMRIALEALNP